MILSEFLTSEPDPEPVCKGAIFRYRTHCYPTLKGGYRNGFELIPLKKLSCPGCRRCGNFASDLSDMDFEIDIADAVTHGDIVELDYHEFERDWETGYIDGYRVVARKVQS